VKNEKRQRYDNQPYGDWDQRLQALIYPKDHPYHHPVIGSVKDLDAATLEDVAAFFGTYYVPNNAVLTIVGDFDESQVMDLVQRYFGEIEAGAPIPPLPGDSCLEPIIGDTVREHVFAEVPLARVIMGFRIPPYSSEDFAVAEVSRALLGMGRASRLYRALVRERRVAKGVVTYAFPLLTNASMLLTWATGYPDSTPEQLEAALTEEIEALVEAKQSEVDRAIALTETDLVRALEHVGERANLLSMFDLYFDDPDRLNHEIDRLRAVTVEQIRDFAVSQLGSDNRAVLVYEPKRKS
jgi:predicted Zn-dependent peptidase